MSEDTNTERLRALAQQLVGLLDANEVGLHTWHEAVYAKIDEIAAFSSYAPAMRDAFDIISDQTSPTSAAMQRWLEKVERFGLVKRSSQRVHVEVCEPRSPRLPQGT